MFLDIAAGVVNNSVFNETSETVAKTFSGDWSLLIWAIILIAATFVFVWVFKQLIANIIAGIVAFLIFTFVLNIPIPINGLTILVTVLGGLGGVAALLIAVFFGWL